MADFIILARASESTEALMCLLVFGGLCAFGFGRLWLIVLIARDSAPAGCACLFVPLLELQFAKEHWNEAKIPATIQLLGLISFGVGIAMVIITS